MTYDEFLRTKKRRFGEAGFASTQLPENLFAWQKKIVQWATKKGRAAIWADTGLGKTAMQLAWADQVHRHTGKPVLILTPIAVSTQTAAEARKFGITATVVDSTTTDPIQICNYQKLHRLNVSAYAGVVLDESSILKSFMGKVKNQLESSFNGTPYRLACTATPAPNDHLELGNHAQFLGIMNSNEMISRWFMADSMQAGNYRLKGHAKSDFWGWVASWAMCIRKPSDMGYGDDGYDLPPLTVQHILIPTEGVRIEGALFADASLSATTLHEVLRQTAPIRARKAAELVNGDPHDNWLVWTHTNYEADELIDVMPSDAIEVRGSDTNEYKEQAALWMAGLTVNRPSDTSQRRILISKSEIFGYGMNFQAISKMIFVGMDYSYEKFYQAVRRCYRYGQTKPVTAYCLATDMEWRLFDSLSKKQRAHEDMQAEMIALMKEASC